MTNTKRLIVLLFLAFVLRLILVPVAHHGDLNNNISWGNEAISRGLINYYGEDEYPEGKNWPYSAPNQPPLYILTFASTSFLFSAISNMAGYLNHTLSLFPSSFVWFWETNGIDLTAKLPGILADLGIAYVIYSYLSKERKQKQGLVFAAVWLFNPVTIYSSAIWGQTDSLVNLLGLLSVYFLLKKNLVFSILYLVLSILFKSSLIIFVPVILLVAFQQKYKIQTWVKAILYSLITIFLITMWFHPQFDIFFWLIRLYVERFLPGEIGYLTANAFNLWWIIDPGKVLDSTVYFGLPARVWGILFALGGIGAIWVNLRKKISDRRIFFALALTAFTSFLFMTRIHERYLYPIFPYLTLLLGLVPSLIIPYIALSLLHLLNLYHLFWAPDLPMIKAWYINPTFMQLLALSHLAIFGYLMYKFIKTSK